MAAPPAVATTFRGCPARAASEATSELAKTKDATTTLMGSLSFPRFAPRVPGSAADVTIPHALEKAGGARAPPRNLRVFSEPIPSFGGYCGSPSGIELDRKRSHLRTRIAPREECLANRGEGLRLIGGK